MISGLWLLDLSLQSALPGETASAIKDNKVKGQRMA